MHPGPSSSTIVRSIPGNAENGPSRATSAMLTRHAKSSSDAPAGCRAISVVRPAPFFHGIERKSSGVRRRGIEAQSARLKEQTDSRGKPYARQRSRLDARGITPAFLFGGFALTGALLAALDCTVSIISESSMRKILAVAAATAFAAAGCAAAQETKVAIGMSGWTGFQPLTLAKEAGIFKKNGLDVSLKMIPQKDRHLAIASGDVQCAATTVETWIVWNASGVATKQIFQMDKSYGADGMAVRANVAKIADLKGKTVAASAPGTAPYFTLAWFLRKNGLSVKDVTVVNLEPCRRRAGVRRRPERRGDDLRAVPLDGARQSASGQDHRHHARLPDDHGHVRLHAEIPGRQSEGRAGADEQLFRGARDDQEDPQKSNEIMGAPTKQTGEAFGKSAAYLRWQDKAANQKFFAGEFQQFSKEAADCCSRSASSSRSPTSPTSSTPRTSSSVAGDFLNAR
jgi:NitT/TauT family transport system substrate-binding protein